MATFFISDLHLDENNQKISGLFLNFIKNELKQGDTLYILGDFFESWIGDDDLTSFHSSIIKGLRDTTSRGVPIYIMHGNRDFLLGKKFMKTTGCKALPDEHVTTLNQTPVLLMHGDTLCREDKNYLKFRKKTRCWLIQKLFLLKSLEKRRAIANDYRKKSEKYVATAPTHIMDVTQSEVERVMNKHHVQTLIHGHTHRQNIHHFQLNQKPATRTVLGAWHTDGNALIWHSDGRHEFIVIK
jgi:UDP-2,3-diacylglucosamine hydrolase